MVICADAVDQPRQLKDDETKGGREMRPRLKQIEKASAVYRRNESYRGSTRIKLRCAVITGSNLGLAAHGNNKTEILNRNVADELVPGGAVSRRHMAQARREG
jgi:hypothetical protein